MANAWGELSWNSGLWGQQNDAIAAPTGIGLTSSVGDESAFNNSGWGRQGWNELAWGVDFQNASVDITGLQLNTSLNNVGVSGEINSGWGRLAWGENAWGIQGDVLITGIGLDVGAGVGSVTATAESDVTGQQLNLNTGTVTAFGLAEVFPTGEQLNLSTGTVDPAPDVMLTGIGLTSSTGTLEGYNEEGWGRTYWGEEVWGASGFWAFAPVTGEQLNISQGEETTTANADIDITGNPLQIAEGIVDPSPDAMVTGIGMTVGVGLGSIVADSNLSLTGSQLNLSLGDETITATANVSISGQGLTAAEGIVDPSPDATVVGIGLTAGVALGSVIEADANVTITGIGLEIAQGQAELDAVTFASTTGQQLNTSLNSVVAGASAEVPLTGNQLTITSGSINVQSWQIVDTGTSVTWNEIDTAA